MNTLRRVLYQPRRLAATVVGHVSLFLLMRTPFQSLGDAAARSAHWLWLGIPMQTKKGRTR